MGSRSVDLSRLKRSTGKKCLNIGCSERSEHPFFELFLGFLRVKMRKQEEMRENESSSEVIKKISKKRVDKYRHLVYNKQACLAGIYLSAFLKRRCLVWLLLVFA